MERCGENSRGWVLGEIDGAIQATIVLSGVNCCFSCEWPFPGERNSRLTWEMNSWNRNRREELDDIAERARRRRVFLDEVDSCEFNASDVVATLAKKPVPRDNEIEPMGLRGWIASTKWPHDVCVDQAWEEPGSVGRIAIAQA